MSKHITVLNQIITGFAILLVSIFAIWWFQIDRIPTNFGQWWIFDLLIFLTLSYIVWHPIVMAVFTWMTVSHIKPITAPPTPKDNLRVAFLTTFVPASESIDLLHKCLPSMVAAEYPHDTWLLDEGNDPRAQEICKQYGVKYFTRAGLTHYNQESGKFKAKTKGGNHNAWHDTHGHDYNIIAQIDTDFITHPQFLMETLGYFNDPNIGFVGTPQVYGNTQDYFIARGAAEQTYGFYGQILRGFAGMNMNTLIGANHLIRKEALESVDHYSAHITEDLLTGMKMHAKGWTSTYVPKTLAIGEGPKDWQSFFGQQMRWAYGCMDILFRHSPTLFRSMTLRQQMYYFLLQQHYFSGLVMALGILGLLSYFLLGIEPAQTELLPFLAFYLPTIAIMEFMSLWIQQFHINPTEESGMLWAGRILQTATWPIFVIAFIGVLMGKKLTYKVTPKGKENKAKKYSLSLFQIHIILGILTILATSTIFFTGRGSVVMLFWAILNIGLLLFVPFSQQIFEAYFYYRNILKAQLPRISHIQIPKIRVTIKEIKPFVVPACLGIFFMMSYPTVYYRYTSGQMITSNITVPIITVPQRNSLSESVEPDIEEESSTPLDQKESLPEIMEAEDTTRMNPYVISAKPGEGVTQMARRAIQMHLEATSQTMTPEEFVFTETKLKDIYKRESILTNDVISFNNADLEQVSEQAYALSESQRRSWRSYSFATFSSQ